MTGALGSVLVIAKQPRPGFVKTRLVPPLTHEQAADVAAAALRDTLEAVGRVPASRHVLAFDGDPEGWLPTGWTVTAQPDGGLDDRLVAAFAAVGGEPAVLVGMDTPQLRPEQVAAFDPDAYDACLGMAADGGYWAIGFADPARAADTIRGVPMSAGHTGAVQLDRLREEGLRVQLLDKLVDVDTIGTAHEVARHAPGTRFAAALTAVQLPAAAEVR